MRLYVVFAAQQNETLSLGNPVQDKILVNTPTRVGPTLQLAVHFVLTVSLSRNVAVTFTSVFAKIHR